MCDQILLHTSKFCAQNQTTLPQSGALAQTPARCMKTQIFPRPLLNMLQPAEAKRQKIKITAWGRKIWWHERANWIDFLMKDFVALREPHPSQVHVLFFQRDGESRQSRQTSCIVGTWGERWEEETITLTHSLITASHSLRLAIWQRLLGKFSLSFLLFLSGKRKNWCHFQMAAERTRRIGNGPPDSYTTHISFKFVTGSRFTSFTSPLFGDCCLIRW